MRLLFHFFFLSIVARRWGLSMLLLAGCAGLSRAQAPALGLAVAVGTYAGSTGQSAVSRTLIDAQGYVYVTGSFSGTVQFGSFTRSSTATQGFVAKLDGAGNYQWVATTTSPSGSYCGSIVQEPATGQLLVAGSFYGASVTLGSTTLANTSTAPVFNTDGFVARLDPSGNWLWALPVGGAGSEGLSQVVLDAAGNSYVVGGFSGSGCTFGSITLPNSGSAGTYELCVAKLSAAGTWLWARSGGSSNQDGGTALALDASNNVYVVGFSQASAATFGPFSLPNTTSANDDVLVAKLDTDGTWQWVVRAGGSGIDDGNGLAVDAAGNAYVTGYFRSATATFGPLSLANSSGPADTGDAFVAKLNTAGTWQWAVRGGGSGGDSGSSLAFTPGGQLALAGTFGGTTAPFGPLTLTNTAGGGGVYNPVSVFLATLSPAGTWLGAVATQGGETMSASALAVDGYGNISLGGSFTGASATVGATALSGAAGATTGFVTLVPMLPIVASLAPGSGTPGQEVTVTGTGFAGVTDVLFNGKSASAFTVQSASRLLATVPPGATAGPVRVLTSVGAGNSPVPFQALAPLAASGPATVTTGVWPSPAGVGEPWQVRLAAVPTAPTPVEVRNALGQLVLQTQLAGQAGQLPVPRLAPGVYLLMLRPGGQPAVQQRVVVVE